MKFNISNFSDEPSGFRMCVKNPISGSAVSWAHGLHATCTLTLQVQIPLSAWMFILISLCYPVKVKSLRWTDCRSMESYRLSQNELRNVMLYRQSKRRLHIKYKFIILRSTYLSKWFWCTERTSELRFSQILSNLVLWVTSELQMRLWDLMVFLCRQQYRGNQPGVSPTFSR